MREKVPQSARLSEGGGERSLFGQYPNRGCNFLSGASTKSPTNLLYPDDIRHLAMVLFPETPAILAFLYLQNQILVVDLLVLLKLLIFLRSFCLSFMTFHKSSASLDSLDWLLSIHNSSFYPSLFLHYFIFIRFKYDFLFRDLIFHQILRLSWTI